MSVIVRDDGFHPVSDIELTFVDLERLSHGVEYRVNLDLPNDQDPAPLQPHFCWIRLIRIPFPDFSDGRGFSLAKRLRQFGYGGVLRAQGHLIADQYNQARQSGFDEVEIDELLAQRQPEWQWLGQVQKRKFSYQKHLLRVA